MKKKVIFLIAFISLLSSIYTVWKITNLVTRRYDNKESLAQVPISDNNKTTILSYPTIQPTPTIKPSPANHITKKHEVFNLYETLRVYVTYYGWSDNDPPGTAIAYPNNRYPESTIHSEAGGIGTFNDPLTFASNDSRFSVGTKLYVPYLKKYIVMEDLCASCNGLHIDIWMQSNGSFEDELFACQRHWTRSSEVVEINPVADRPVEYTPLFNQTTGECLENI